ncbi:DEAD/DEAH box helicase [Microcella sp.]|uniref:DEAD/DEAH box helicase n=1 Tax=Microcella sp. TaxID=1913979 RepID=UPI00299F8044|nr:DEAD/DEAH box helicase [Microcella sp.]MDX2025276.1 DEAD/DEAH box helicase [Microcella sp.]
MPQNNKGGASRAPQSSRSSAPRGAAPRGAASRGAGAKSPAPGSRSPKHRGYRPDEAAAPEKKARWSRDERVDRGHAPERARPERDDRAARPSRDDRPQRSFDRDARPARSSDRDDRAPRYDDRVARPARAGDRDARPARSGDRDDRPARDDRGAGNRSSNDRGYRPASTNGRPARPSRDGDTRDGAARTGTGRATHRPDWRPQTGAANTGRPARSFDRDARPARDDRAPRSFDRDARPARSFDRDDRAPRFYERDARPARSFDRDERPIERRESSFYPSRDTKAAKVDDVVLDRLTADAVLATDVEGVTFADLGLGANIVRELEEQGARSPFPIQAATIPDVLAGKDVLGRGRTGSGKTIAFGAPLVERLMENGGGKKRQMGRAPRALILAPTRELALQIDRTVQPIARSVGLFTTQIYGGVPQGRQVGALQRGVDIIIGTPGRIEDLIEQGRLDLSQIEIVVLDEADHMCELGFLEPVQRIIRRTRPNGQRLLFSATLDSGVASLVTEFLDKPAVYEVAGEDQESSTIDHKVLLVDQREKRGIIEQLAAGDGKTLIFARTRAFAEELADQLDDAGIPAVSLHGDLNQARRTRNLEKLTSGRVNVLVATDVAARGIHVDDISLVIQADAPDEYKTYLHRSGRTGRAGKVGTVVTLITRQRARRFDELLQRAEIEAETTEVRVGDAFLDRLAAL